MGPIFQHYPSLSCPPITFCQHSSSLACTPCNSLSAVLHLWPATLIALFQHYSILTCTCTATQKGIHFRDGGCKLAVPAYLEAGYGQDLPVKGAGCVVPAYLEVGSGCDLRAPPGKWVDTMQTVDRVNNVPESGTKIMVRCLTFPTLLATALHSCNTFSTSLTIGLQPSSNTPFHCTT